MVVPTEIRQWQELKFLHNNSIFGVEHVEPEWPTQYFTAPVIEWVAPEWTGQAGITRGGWIYRLYKASQMRIIKQLFWKYEEPVNCWMLRVQSPDDETIIDDKIIEYNEGPMVIANYLNDCHPK